MKFGLIGVDLIIDQTQKPYIIEVNDSPSIIFPFGISNEERKVIEEFLFLLSRKGINEIHLQLSDKYYFENQDDFERFISSTEDKFVCDFKNILSIAKSRGFKSYIYHKNNIPHYKKYLSKINLGNVCLFRRGTYSISENFGLIINTTNVRNLFRDKLLTFNLLRELKIPTIDTYNEPFKSLHVIRKPRYGYGSIDVTLLKQTIAQKNMGDFIYQPFIDAATLKFGEKEFKFDVRLNYIGNVFLNGFLRLSAFPNNSIIDKYDEACWLTTLGRCCRLSILSDKTLICIRNLGDTLVNRLSNVALPVDNKKKTIDPYKAFRTDKFDLINK